MTKQFKSMLTKSLMTLLITTFLLSCSNNQKYKTVTIGDQIWMAENLNVDKFRNGDPIPQAQTAEEWQQAGENGQPAWCYYDNDPANSKIYGKLYNWYAVSDWRGLAPEGWRVPSDADWDKLIKLIGGEKVAGGKLKATDTTYWESPNTGATNETGFTALPGGGRYFSGAFYNIGNDGVWWSATEINSDNAWYRFMNYYGSDVSRDSYYYYEELGFSVRCLRDLKENTATGIISPWLL